MLHESLYDVLIRAGFDPTKPFYYDHIGRIGSESMLNDALSALLAGSASVELPFILDERRIYQITVTGILRTPRAVEGGSDDALPEWYVEGTNQTPDNLIGTNVRFYLVGYDNGFWYQTTNSAD